MTLDNAIRTSTPPPLDPELAAGLARIPFMSSTLHPHEILEARERRLNQLPDRDVQLERLRRDGSIEVTEREVPGPLGGPDITVLIMAPTNPRTVPSPTIYYIHGGGMVMGTRFTGVDGLADLVDELGVVAVSVEYRLAPENPYPAPVEDCYAGLVWITENAEDLGIDSSRIIVMGASAGGGLAAAIALFARDHNGPAISHLVLGCPMLDDRGITPSSQELDGIGVFDRTSNKTGWGALLGDAAGGPDVSYYAAPARATDLSGLPPTFLDVGQVETFRDEVINFAARLSQSGVLAELHVWPGAFHGFEVVVTSDISKIAGQTRRAYIARALS
ncbi:esterase [Rhodococcus sp. ACPA1]|nr:esterase [Rhodococcus sp. ACPA1]